MTCQATHLRADVRRHGNDTVVVVRLDSYDARRLCSPKPDREECSERDRHLPEDVSWLALADDALDSIDKFDRLDATIEQAEERSLVALVCCVFAGVEVDVGGNTTEPLAIRRLETLEHSDAADLVRRHHARPRNHRPMGAVPAALIVTPDTA
jgi:hypothetical protein